MFALNPLLLVHFDCLPEKKTTKIRVIVDFPSFPSFPSFLPLFRDHGKSTALDNILYLYILMMEINIPCLKLKGPHRRIQSKI